jgi:inorganic pyrophosphatase
MPHALIERLRHYFMTYKSMPEEPADISIGEAYDRDHAEKVILAAINDYETEFGAE